MTQVSFTEKEAKTKGKELLDRMKGKGWKVEVWENVGWYYKIISGPIKVYPSIRDGEYICLLGEGPSAGNTLWTNQDAFVDPNEAVRSQVELARQKVTELDALVRQAEVRAGLI